VRARVCVRVLLYVDVLMYCNTPFLIDASPSLPVAQVRQGFSTHWRASASHSSSHPTRCTKSLPSSPCSP
jgi:hypothetical protein